MTKQQQTNWNKPKKFNKNAYFNWIHSNNFSCVVCGRKDIELHHITDIHELKGERRIHTRIVPLCLNHHRVGKFAIHNMAKDEFYENVMDLDTLLFHSNRILEEYENEREA